MYNGVPKLKLFWVLAHCEQLPFVRVMISSNYIGTTTYTHKNETVNGNIGLIQVMP